jgi:hypothetical protein
MLPNTASRLASAVKAASCRSFLVGVQRSSASRNDRKSPAAAARPRLSVALRPWWVARITRTAGPYRSATATLASVEPSSSTRMSATGTV